MLRRSVLAVLPSVFAARASDWPQLLGPQRNGISLDTAPPGSLRKARLLWKREVGAGFSAPVVAAGKLILFHRLENKEVVECLDAANAKSVWKAEYPTAYRDDFGFDEGPRGTPSVAQGRVFTFGAEGALQALDLLTGKRVWQVDTYPKFSVPKGFFGAAASPLADSGSVYVNIGGPNGTGLVCFDQASGKVRWSATSDEAGYSSPIAAPVDGVKSILCFNRAGLVALDPASGAVRFSFPFRSRCKASVNAALPIVVGNQIFLSASYETGAALLQVAANKVSVVWKSDESLSNHYATSVYRQGYVFGFHGRQEFGQSLRCIEWKTGKVQWSSDGYGAGTVTLLADKLLIVRESGEAILAQASPTAYQPLESTQLLPGVIRSYPAIADNRIFVRNEKQLAAYSLGNP